MTQKANPLDEEEAPAFSSDRRVWKLWQPTRQGASGLVLKTIGILYDAGKPLTRDELADQLVARLEPTERGYLEAWYLRFTEQVKRSWAKTHPNSKSALPNSSRPIPSITSIARRWISQRIVKTHIIRDPDGRYRPGPTPPLAQTMDGRLLRFTPEERQRLAQADHDSGRTHLASIEWRDLQRRLAITTPEALAQVASFLLRRYWLPERGKRPFDERQLQGECQRLLQLADTDAIRRAVVQMVIKDLLGGT